jgi:hypothetical protein
MSCTCKKWIQGSDVPGKMIVLKCNLCGTSYTLFPNGQISYEEPVNSVTFGSVRST